MAILGKSGNQQQTQEQENLYFNLLKMPLVQTVCFLLNSILNWNISNGKYEFLAFLMPKTLNQLTSKVEKNLQMASAVQAITLMRFFVAGFQVDASAFHDIIPKLTRIIEFTSDNLRLQLVHLVQIGMAVHNGHPEKYKEITDFLTNECQE